MQQTNHTIHFLLLNLFACVFFLSACHDSDSNPVEALPFSNDGISWGLIATDGTVLQPAESFSQPPSVVVGNMFNIADGKGHLRLYNIKTPSQPVCQRTFARIGHFFENVAPAQETPTSPILLIDKEGNNIASTAQYPQYDIVLMHNFSEGRALFSTINGKYGYMDTKGNIVIPPVYDRAYDFHEGMALVGNTNNQGQTGYLLIDPNGKIKSAIRLSNTLLDTGFADNRLLFYELNTRHIGYLDKEGNPTLYLSDNIILASRYKGGMAIVQTEDGIGVIDNQGKPLIPMLYEKANIVNKGLVTVKKDGLWGLINPSIQSTARFLYDSIGIYYNKDLAVACQNGRKFFINTEGNPIGNTTYAHITEDPTASRLKPQCFIKQYLSTENIENQQSDKTDNNDEKDERKDITSSQNKDTSKGHMESSSQIEQQDWRKVSKQHPFYQEAAKVVSGKLEEKDAESRQMILNYVEHLRTSYTTKDIDFLEQLFSENALIIVGTMVHTSQQETNYLSPSQVIYNVKSKRQYLDRLKQVFKANQSIDVQFSDFHIMRHPTTKGIYGVSLRQKYQSDIYSDDGYLFLLWDFRDETAPKIHVRTWQPRMQADHTPLPENKIFNINNFNLQ